MYDVAVVGFGPAGEVATSTLGAAGHRVVAFDRQPKMYPLPRMVTFDGEACRTVQSTGTSIDKALESSSILYTCTFTDENLDPVMTIDWGGRQGGFEAHRSVFQPDIEATLDEKIRTMPNVEVRRGFEIVELQQHPDFVELTVQPKGSIDPTERETVTARYVIGADGTNSIVRQKSGIEWKDYGLHERWLNFDMNLKRELDDELRHLVLAMDPKRPHMYMPLGTLRQRFEFRVHEDETEEQMMNPQVVWDFIDEHYGLGPDDLEIARQLVYHYYTRVATEWRKDRVFIAGDAAHTMTPYMGQGGCSAIRDGRNIAWRLDLVLKGVSEDGILDDYQVEREAHVSQLVFTSHEFSNLINMTDPVKAAERNHAIINHLAPPPPPFPKLEGGALHREPDGTIAPITGSLAPQGTLRKGAVTGRGDDVLQSGFQLISRTQPELTPEQASFFADLGGAIAVVGDPSAPDAVEDVDGEYTRFLDQAGADAYIMRPDWYIFGAVRCDDLGRLVDELAERLRERVGASK
jgi:3-(3-hydroxy-phenyl)propionate hydroxylase